MCRMLLKFKSDPNMEDCFGWTCLAHAIANNDLRIMKLLLINFANPWSTILLNYNEICENKVYCLKLLR